MWGSKDDTLRMQRNACVDTQRSPLAFLEHQNRTTDSERVRAHSLNHNEARKQNVHRNKDALGDRMSSLGGRNTKHLIKGAEEGASLRIL